MIQILRILFILISLPFASLFIINPINSINRNFQRYSLARDNLESPDYNLAKEYYFYKTKGKTDFSLELGDTDSDYIEFAKSREKNNRIFESNWFTVKSHNKKNEFKLKINKFADTVNFNTNTYHSDLMNKTITTDNKFPFKFIDKIKEIYNIIFTNYPKQVDWRKSEYLSQVKNQGSCGSCWAFSSTSALEAFLRKNNLKVDRLSEQELIDCSKENYGCQGGLMDKAFDYCISNNGLHSNSNYPYEAKNNECMGGCSIDLKNCTDFDKVLGSDDFTYKYTQSYSINSLKEAVIKNPVPIAINANTPIFRFYSEGVIDSDFDTPSELNHAVLLVGYNYDKKGLYWIIQNSWGKDWGDKGYVKIRGKEGEGVLSCQIYGVYPIKKDEKN